MRHATFFAIGLLSSTFLLTTPTSGRATPMFMGLGDLAGGDFYSKARAVSADGSVVVGESVTAGGGGNVTGLGAFRWTQSGGMVGLGSFGGESPSRAFGVSADGSVVVGVSSANRAFRWTEAGGMVALTPNSGMARAVSSDGSVVVGAAPPGAFLWTPSNNAGGEISYFGAEDALSISGDGSVVVGGRPAYRCVVGNGVACSDLASEPNSQANAVSADGSIIVGNTTDSSSLERAFLWTQAGGMVPLDDNPPPLGVSQAYGVSGDGSVIVGQRDYRVGVWPSGSSEEAFVWTHTGGMRGLRDVLVDDYGLDLGGFELVLASAVSADGRTIVGEGFNADGNVEAWLAVLPEPSTALLLATALSGLAVALFFGRS